MKKITTWCILLSILLVGVSADSHEELDFNNNDDLYRALLNGGHDATDALEYLEQNVHKLDEDPRLMEFLGPKIQENPLILNDNPKLMKKWGEKKGIAFNTGSGINSYDDTTGTIVTKGPKGVKFSLGDYSKVVVNADGSIEVDGMKISGTSKGSSIKNVAVVDSEGHIDVQTQIKNGKVEKLKGEVALGEGSFVETKSGRVIAPSGKEFLVVSPDGSDIIIEGQGIVTDTSGSSKRTVKFQGKVISKRNGDLHFGPNSIGRVAYDGKDQISFFTAKTSLRLTQDKQSCERCIQDLGKKNYRVSVRNNIKIEVHDINALHMDRVDGLVIIDGTKGGLKKLVSAGADGKGRLVYQFPWGKKTGEFIVTETGVKLKGNLPKGVEVQSFFFKEFNGALHVYNTLHQNINGKTEHLIIRDGGFTDITLPERGWFKEGDEGDDVIALKKMLNDRLRGKIKPLDVNNNKYDAKTMDAVKLLQKELGFTGKNVDGFFGGDTRRAYLGTILDQKGISYGSLATPDGLLREVKFPSRGWFKERDGYSDSDPTTREQVRKLQEALLKGGYYDSLPNNCERVADGKYGPCTALAVKALQKKLKVKDDGAFGSKTLQAWNAQSGPALTFASWNSATFTVTSKTAQVLKNPPLKRTNAAGMRKHPTLKYIRFHSGADQGNGHGNAVFAAGDGIVVKKGRVGSYGNYVKIKHDDGTFSTAYAHLSRYGNVAEGKKVKKGEVIGYVGSTGRSSGPHLHYEVLKKIQEGKIYYKVSGNPVTPELAARVINQGQGKKVTKHVSPKGGIEVFTTICGTDSGAYKLKC